MKTQHFHGKIHEPMNFYLILNDDGNIQAHWFIGKKNNIIENSHYHCSNITEKYRDSHDIEKIVKTLKKA